MNQQLHLFNRERYRCDKIPEWLDILLQDENTLIAVGVSGGKDSQAMLSYLTQQKYRAKLIAVYADVGERVVWLGTKDFIQHQCALLKVDLIIVKRDGGDLYDYILERKAKRNGEVFWPSAASRYCTSSFKIAPINKYLRKYQTVINATGIRALESSSRSKKSAIAYHATCSQHYQQRNFESAVEQHLKKPLGRLSIDYKPIFYWDLERVWQQCGHSTADWQRRRKIKSDRESTEGWNYHYAYVVGRGNERLSCAYCMLASNNDLQNAKAYNRSGYQFICELEKSSGYSFKSRQFLHQL